MQIITLNDITLYRDDQTILQNISWTIKQNEHWALIGPNGSGKTTLLKIISGNTWPSAGKISVLGKQFGKTDLRELKKKIGWVSSYLVEKIPLNEKVLDVIISGKDASFGVYSKINKKDKEKAHLLLDFLDCAYVKDRSFHIISQGERQKVLIARALMADPLLLILDEPCTGLDMKARSSLLQSISKLCKQKNTHVIYVTHHFDEIVDEINNIFMIKEGNLLMKGGRELLEKKNS